MKKLPEVDITIVNYNGGQVILDCLRSIFDLRDKLEFKVWVIDNASGDGSTEEIRKNFPRVRMIVNTDNVGFGRAHNQALKQVKGDYVLILNPDTRIENGVIEELVTYLSEHDDVGAITPKIVFENGKIDLTAHRGFPTPMAALKYYIWKDDSLYHLTDRMSNTPHEVDSIGGAFFLVPRKVLDIVGLFDEDYFMYAEDIDLCLRIKKAGYKVIYYPGQKVLHYKGVLSGIKEHSVSMSQANVASKKRALDAFYETMWIFYRKHYFDKYSFFVNWLVWLGIHLKWLQAKRKMVV